MDAQWGVAKAGGELLKFGGGFYCARLPKRLMTAVVPSAGDILSTMPRGLMSGLDTLALPNGHIDDSEKMLLFPESVSGTHSTHSTRSTHSTHSTRTSCHACAALRRKNRTRSPHPPHPHRLSPHPHRLSPPLTASRRLSPPRPLPRRPRRR